MTDIMRRCPGCSGAGTIDGLEFGGGGSMTCPSCNGAGEIVLAEINLSDIEDKLNGIMDKCNDIKEKVDELGE